MLDRIRVLTPCREDWELMGVGDRARFCGQCDKNVYDISTMTRIEAEALVATGSGQLCVRFYRELDGSIRTKDEVPSPSVRLPHASRLVNATLAGLLAFQVATQAQVNVVPGASSPVSAVGEQKGAKLNRTPRVGRSSLSGTVMDPNRAVIVGARMTLTNTLTRETGTVVSSEEGRFEFRDAESGEYVLDAEASGFILFQSRLVLRTNTDARLDVSLELAAGLITMGVFTDGVVEPTPIPRELLTPIKAVKILPERTPK